MATKPKSPCPHCDKSFVNVNLHIRKSHDVFTLKRTDTRKFIHDITIFKNGKEFHKVICIGGGINHKINGEEYSYSEYITVDEPVKSKSVYLALYYKTGTDENKPTHFEIKKGNGLVSEAGQKQQPIVKMRPIVWA